MRETLRLVRAFAWMRWRLTLNHMRQGRRKGGMEAVSAAASVALPVLFGILIIPLLLGLGAASAIGGWGIAARGGVFPTIVGAGLRIHLAIQTLALLIGPLVRSAQGGVIQYGRIALLPVPRTLLHAIELVSGLADPWMLAATPPLALVPLGFLAGGGSPVGAAIALAAGVAMGVLLISLAGLAQFLLHLVFRNRRRGEAVFLVFMVAVSSLGLISSAIPRIERPEARVGRGEPKSSQGRPAVPGGPAGSPSAAGRTFPDLTPRGWSRIIPSELYAAAALEAMAGHPARAAATTAALGLEAFFFYWASLRAWRRLLETPATGSSRRGTNRLRGLPRLGFLPVRPQVSAVAAALVRVVLRTVTGKMAVFFSPLFSLLFGIAFFHVRTMPPAIAPLIGGILAGIAGLFGILSLQAVLLNQFAGDRAGLTLQFLAPLSDRDIVRGKILGAGLLVLIAAGLGILPAAALAPKTNPLLYACAVMFALGAYALAGPAGAVLSALLPVTMDLGRIGRSARPHQGATLAFFPVLAVGVGPGAALSAFGLIVLHSPLATLGLLVGWFVLATALGALITTLAVELMSSRRENLELVATGR